MSEQEYFTAAEVAEKFRVHKNTVLGWARRGKLRVWSCDQTVRFRAEDVRALEVNGLQSIRKPRTRRGRG